MSHVISLGPMTDQAVVLDTDAAVVLFEMLHRWEDEDADLQLIPGEQTALWVLSAALERVLAESFDPRYSDILQQARERLFARGGA